MDYWRTKYLTANEGYAAIREAVEGHLRQVWTVLPVSVSEDSDGHVAKLKSNIKVPQLQLDGTIKMVEMPDFDTAPVHFRGGGGTTHTHPVKKDDEGIALFASMAQDLWHEKGGVQDPVDHRRHHLADGRYIAGGRSDPRKLNPAPSKTSDQSRSDDGKHVFDLHPQQGLTSASEEKVTAVAGGRNGAGTVHLKSGLSIKNAKKAVLINTVEHADLPPPGASIANKKSIATKPMGAIPGTSQGSQISAAMGSMLSGGSEVIFSNPTELPYIDMINRINSSFGLLNGVPGAGALIDAFTLAGGMFEIAANLSNLAGALCGAFPAPGVFGLTELLAHADNVTNFFGDTVPPAVSMDKVIAPLQTGDLLTSLGLQGEQLIADVVGTRTSVDAAVAVVNGWTAHLQGVIDTANLAFTTLIDAVAMLSSALAAANAGISQSAAERAVHSAILTPQLAALTQLMNEVVSPSAEDAASISAFPDPASPGATGGM